ncbi:MAG TPA: DUF1697 domain-containing protein [Gemmatimonadales bacterium]|jgi:uncharacterized protein (DUF1697 family)
MPRLIAFLRAINVGGHVVKMDQLRGHFVALGFADVETFIASGNVIFAAASHKAPALEQKIEARLRTALGYEVRTFVRTGPDVAAIARYRPFRESQLKKAGALNVGFLAEPLGPGSTRALMGLKTAIDDFHVNGREVYWWCAKRQSESTFSNAVFERTLKVSTTFRGLKTVVRLAERYGFAPEAG